MGVCQSLVPSFLPWCEHQNSWIYGCSSILIAIDSYFLDLWMFIPQIWVNYNISLTWIKAIWGWFPLLTMIPSEGEQWGRYNLPCQMLLIAIHSHPIPQRWAGPSAAAAKSPACRRAQPSARARPRHPTTYRRIMHVSATFMCIYVCMYIYIYTHTETLNYTNIDLQVWCLKYDLEKKQKTTTYPLMLHLVHRI